MASRILCSVVLLFVCLVLSHVTLADATRRTFPFNGESAVVEEELQAESWKPIETFLKSFSLFETIANLWRNSGSRLAEWPLQLSVPLAPRLEATDGKPEVGQYAGYFRLNRTHDARMFYFFFESRGNKSEDPVVLWMTGGPGCSSELAVFYENGPFYINSDNKTLRWNDHGWDMVANMIFVDQPVNTGFSYSEDPRDMRHDENGVSDDVYDFLQVFFEAHPEYADRDFFVTGESYAGHYVPAVTSRIVAGNKKKEGPPINLKGFAIGNGLTRPNIQYAAYPDFTLSEGLISQRQHRAFVRSFTPCGVTVKACGTSGHVACSLAFAACNTWFQAIYEAVGDRNVYDIRIPCEVEPLCYDFSPLDKYLGQPAVRAALGVGSRRFESCSAGVYRAMMQDFMRSLEPVIPPLLEESVRLLVYAGEKDLICNWLGNSRWVAAMEWSGRQAYLDAPWSPFEVDGATHGTATGAGPLTFLKVADAGHMVPMDQPAAALEMLRRFIHNVPFVSGDRTVAAPHAQAKSSGEAEVVVLAAPAAEEDPLRSAS